MSSVQATTEVTPASTPSFWARVEAVMVRVGDRLNPILVKETRQALKSRQFLITFVLVLAACWIWSLLGIAMIGPRVYYSAEAVELFFGYYLILTFPLAIIIPFTAYRSLAGEREDNTYELLSITTLSPRQIISGKLGSAVIQMIVYFSAVAPCLAFTYMLRGIDILTIGLLLYYAFFGSLGLSMIALSLATVTRQKYLQVIISVTIVLALALVFRLNIEIAEEILTYGSGWIHDDDFWISNGLILNLFVTTFALVFLAAAAQLTFPSENRSTALRWAMLVQHACVGAWVSAMFVMMIYEGPRVVIGVASMVLMTVLGVYWYVMGAMMTGESSAISERVRRGLPKSFFGRTFLTWFNPGPSSGYMFALANLAGGGTFVLAGLAVAAFFEGNISTTGFIFFSGPSLVAAACFTVLVIAYVAFFLGLGNLVLKLLRKFVPVQIFTAVIIHILILLVFTFVPLVVHLMSMTYRGGEYTLLQVTNPFWTLAEIGDNNPIAFGLTILMVMLVVPISSVVVFAANIPGIVAEVGRIRIAEPARVTEEDAELNAVVSRPTSPWDD